MLRSSLLKFAPRRPLPALRDPAVLGRIAKPLVLGLPSLEDYFFGALGIVVVGTAFVGATAVYAGVFLVLPYKIYETISDMRRENKRQRDPGWKE